MVPLSVPINDKGKMGMLGILKRSIVSELLGLGKSGASFISTPGGFRDYRLSLALQRDRHWPFRTSLAISLAPHDHKHLGNLPSIHLTIDGP
jgi:hypothetical protein